MTNRPHIRLIAGTLLVALLPACAGSGQAQTRPAANPAPAVAAEARPAAPAAAAATTPAAPAAPAAPPAAPAPATTPPAVQPPAAAVGTPGLTTPGEMPRPFDLSRPDIQAFVDGVAKRQKVDRRVVLEALGAGMRQPRILDAISRPAERVLPWWEYRARFLTERRIAEGADFWLAHRERLERAEKETGVPPAYVVAIIGVETFYGRITGSWRVLDALMTLGFDYPPRAEFFRGELEQFLLLAREERIDLRTALGSYAGAMGAPQFIPSSYRRLAVDGNGDGRRDLFSEWDDVVASVANYFEVNGWRAGEPVLTEATAAPEIMGALDPRNLNLNETIGALRARGIGIDGAFAADTPAILLPAELQDRANVRVGFRNFQVITRYNRSIRYAMAVHDLAQAITERVAQRQTVVAAE